MEENKMKMKLWGLAVAAALVIPQAASADAVGDFYKDKQVKIIIGSGMGGRMASTLSYCRAMLVDTWPVHRL